MDPATEPADEAAEEAAAGATPVKVKTRKPTAESTFRALIGEHTDFTSLADSKAHMMIQVNGLIMSILLASSRFILESELWLRLPCASLAVTALVSIVYAVAAARPKLLKPRSISIDDLRSGRANLLFFGNFSRVSEDDFAAAMRDMFSEDDRVYDTLSRHVHGLGSVLVGKFRLLRVSYTVFLFGLFAAGALFVVGLVGSGPR
jgi:hypothetical protein